MGHLLHLPDEGPGGGETTDRDETTRSGAQALLGGRGGPDCQVLR